MNAAERMKDESMYNKLDKLCQICICPKCDIFQSERCSEDMSECQLCAVLKRVSTTYCSRYRNKQEKENENV